jgi:hypothetical protein
MIRSSKLGESTKRFPTREAVQSYLRDELRNPAFRSPDDATSESRDPVTRSGLLTYLKIGLSLAAL